jgi:hypothetical protein
MGTNNPNFPNNVRCDEEAIQYLASLVTALKNGTFTALSGAGPFTITAAQMLGGFIEFSGSTTAVTVTTDTAANIIAAMLAADPNAGVGSSFPLTLVNDNTSSGAITVAAGATVTLSGPTPTAIAIANAKRYLVRQTSATAITMFAVGT